MFFQNWKLSLISIIMIPLASISAKNFGKRIGKVATEAQEKSGFLTTYLVELFKNHKLIKIFQKEKFEKNRADKYLTSIKRKKSKNTNCFCKNVSNYGNFNWNNDCNFNILFWKINYKRRT